MRSIQQLDFANRFVFTCLLCLVIAGCSRVQSNVILAEPVITTLKTENVELRNCDCPDEMQRVLGDDIKLECITTIADTAAGPDGEAIAIPMLIKTQLRSGVEDAYQTIYQQAKVEAEKTVLTAPPNKIRLYKVVWMEHTYRGMVEFSMDEQVCRADYEYRLHVPTSPSHLEMSCTA